MKATNLVFESGAPKEKVTLTNEQVLAHKANLEAQKASYQAAITEIDAELSTLNSFITTNSIS